MYHNYWHAKFVSLLVWFIYSLLQTKELVRMYIIMTTILTCSIS
jgi:hypothetical protein